MKLDQSPTNIILIANAVFFLNFLFIVILSRLYYVFKTRKERHNNGLLFYLMSTNATIPTRGTPNSAGYDLHSAVKIIIPKGGKAIVPTDIAFKPPTGTYGRVAPRSGFSWKNHTDIGAGVLDPDYRGNIGVMIFNHSDKDIEIDIKDRIAQLILEKYTIASYVRQVFQIQDLGMTIRGDGGFGSTGK